VEKSEDITQRTGANATGQVKGIWSEHCIVEDLPAAGQSRLDAIRPLFEPCDHATYRQRVKDAMVKMGVTQRTIQRWIKEWEEEGPVAFDSDARSDKGRSRGGRSKKEPWSDAENWPKLIIKTWKAGNKDGKRMLPSQVFLRVLGRADALGLRKDKEDTSAYPSHMTVYRKLEPYEAALQHPKTPRRRGWRQDRLVITTRTGEQIEVTCSNQVWQIDHTQVDVLAVDKDGKLRRPYLTTVVDTYGRCLMGLELSMRPRSSTVVALALRHAILPKTYTADYKLRCRWGTLGKPAYVFTDGAGEFKGAHVSRHIADALGFTTDLRDRPSEGGIVERPFGTFNTDFFSQMPGYTGGDVQHRSTNAEKAACISLDELERHFVRYIVDNYNQQLDARSGNQTRFQRWEAGLATMPTPMDEAELDICLMKETPRVMYDGGYIRFDNFTYVTEQLTDYEDRPIIIRYHPDNIATIRIYQTVRDGQRDRFLGIARAEGFDDRPISEAEARAVAKRLRDKGKDISNESILDEIRDRDAFIKDKERARDRRRRKGSGSVWEADEGSRGVEPASRGDGSGKQGAADISSAVNEEPEAQGAIDTPLIQPSAPRVYDFDDLHADY